MSRYFPLANPHRQSRRWIQMDIDGNLLPEDRARLETHLQSCPACRRYADELSILDIHLRSSYLSRSQINPQAFLTRSGARTTESIFQRVRANMITRKYNFAASALYVFGVAVLAVVLIVLFSQLKSNRDRTNPLQPPAVTAIPTFAPSPEPTQEITSPTQTAGILNGLAIKDAAQYSRPGWVYTRETDLGTGSLSSSYRQYWAHYPESSGECSEEFTIVKADLESPEALQLMVWTEEGWGDLIQLRKGQDEFHPAVQDWQFCDMTIEQTPASSLAGRLEGGEHLSKDAGRDFQEVRAWYETIDGTPAFVVEASFTNTGSTPPAQTEKRAFSLETGQLLQESTRMEWEDGSLFGESAYRREVEFMTDLPEDIKNQFQQAKEELAGFASGELTAEAFGQAPPEDSALLDTLSNTKDDPLTDSSQVVPLLQILKQRIMDKLARPGWYQYGMKAEPGQDISYYYQVLLHVLDEDGSCEMMTFYPYANKILPQEIRLADGTYGAIGPVVDGKFTYGNSHDEPCRTENNDAIRSVQNEIDFFSGITQSANAAEQGKFWLWKEEIDGQPVLVVKSDRLSDGLGTVMDPETRKLEKIDRIVELDYFSLESGVWLGQVAEYTLSIGKVIGGEEDRLMFEFTEYAQLPEQLSTAFDQAVEDMREYLQASGE